jgi:DNA-binding transcriptional MerR regulator
MRIGELARNTGVSARSLRHYEAAGLLTPTRSKAGYRDYDQADVMIVGLVKTLIAAGLPVHVIAQLLPCSQAAGGYNCPDPALAAQLEALAEQLRGRREAISRAILVINGVTSRAAHTDS